MPLGYQTTKEFYMPVYETRQQRDNPTPDLRTTIYWNPDIRTGPNGEAEIKFYTADPQTEYSVIIEGMISEGIPVTLEQKIKRTL